MSRPSAARAFSGGTGMSPIGEDSTWPPSFCFSEAGRKFIDGEPMKPATNRLSGCS